MRVNPRQRRRAAALLFVVTLLGWPLSALTWARGEPPFILGLSWLALSLTALDIWLTTDVRAEGERDSEDAAR